MSQDSFSEVSSESWFSRIGNAFKGILIGLVLFIVSFVVLFWNEGRAVQTYRALNEGSHAVIDVPADRVDPANDGKLVHVSGQAVTTMVLNDPVFQVSAPALKLARIVEMYQWKESSSSETEKKLGGGTETKKTYSYSKTWSSDTIDSSEFKHADGHENPDTFPTKSEEWCADPVTVGGFTLNRSQVTRIGNAVPFPVGAEIPESLPLNGPVKVSGTGYYVGKNPASPKVGDIRVTFKVTNPGSVSLVAKQAGTSFMAYTAKNGKAIDLFSNGTIPAEAMFTAAQESNRILTLILRIVGFVLMFVGLSLILKPLSVLADVLPFLGSIIGFGAGIMAFLTSLILSLTTIAIAWIVYRPLVGISLLMVGGGIAYFIRTKMHARKGDQKDSPGALPRG